MSATPGPRPAHRMSTTAGVCICGQKWPHPIVDTAAR